MILLFLVGYVSFLTPTGPITFLIFRNSMLGKYGKAIMVTLGAVVVQFFFCAISLIVINKIISDSILFISRLLSAIIFFILGIYLFISKQKKSEQIINLRDLPGKEKLKSFLFGLFVTFLNPGIILSWLAVNVLFVSFNFITPNNYLDILFLSISAIIGIFLGGLSMIIAVRKNKHLLNDKSINIMAKILGFIIMAISLYLFYSAFFL